MSELDASVVVCLSACCVCVAPGGGWPLLPLQTDFRAAADLGRIGASNTHTCTHTCAQIHACTHTETDADAQHTRIRPDAHAFSQKLKRSSVRHSRGVVCCVRQTLRRSEHFSDDWIITNKVCVCGCGCVSIPKHAFVPHF